MATTTVNPSAFTLEDVLECLTRNGYYIGKREFDDALGDQENAFVMVNSLRPQYVTVAYDPYANDNNCYMVVTIVLELTANGIVGEYAGVPDSVWPTFEDACSRIAQLKG